MDKCDNCTEQNITLFPCCLAPRIHEKDIFNRLKFGLTQGLIFFWVEHIQQFFSYFYKIFIKFNYVKHIVIDLFIFFTLAANIDGPTSTAVGLLVSKHILSSLPRVFTLKFYLLFPQKKRFYLLSIKIWPHYWKPLQSIATTHHQPGFALIWDDDRHPAFSQITGI